MSHLLVDRTASELRDGNTKPSQRIRASLLKYCQDDYDEFHLTDLVNGFLPLFLAHFFLTSNDRMTFRDAIRTIQDIGSFDGITWYFEYELHPYCGPGKQFRYIESIHGYGTRLRTFNRDARRVCLTLLARLADCVPANIDMTLDTLLSQLPGYIRYHKLMAELGYPDSTDSTREADQMLLDFIMTSPISSLTPLVGSAEPLPDIILPSLKSRLMNEGLLPSSALTPSRLGRQRRSEAV